MVKKTHDGVRLLAKGALKTKVDITVAGASKAARAAVEEAGGSLTLIAVKPAPTAATPRKSAAPAAAGA